MPSFGSPPSDDARKRRAHKKSRKGCGNCKLRRVKCDEAKPRCKQCISYGVACYYGPTSAAAALSVEVAFKVDLTTTSPSQAGTSTGPPVRKAHAITTTGTHTFLPRFVPPPLPYAGSLDSPDMEYRLTPNDVRLLERFQKRTILSIGTPTSKQIYEKKTLPMAFRHPFVMHTVLAMTHLHDISLTPFATPQTRASLAYHFHRGASLLHRKLSSPILPSERDALWLAASFVSIASFANVVDIACPGDAWPLRESCPSDLDWMKLSDGKKQVWRLTDPMRSSGVFRDVVNELYAHAMREVVVHDDVDQWGCLPEGFAELYHLREDPTCANPYLAAAEALAACWGAPGSAEPESRETVAPLLGFFNKLDARFRRLLEEKDNRAMLMLSYWYARVCDRRHWWMWRRAVLETRAICEYLERRWEGRWEVKLVEMPKMMAEKCDL